jgi:PASTA domain
MATGMFGGGWRVLAAVVTVAVTACTAGTSATGTAGTANPTRTIQAAPAPSTTGPAAVAIACPASAATGTAAVAQPGPVIAPLIRPGAITAVICQYPLEPSQKNASIIRRITLSAIAARGLAALFDDASTAASPPHCPGFPYGQLVIFGYQSWPAVTASVRFGVCAADTGVVTVGGRTAVFGSPFEPDLSAYSLLGLLGPGPLIPDVTGLSVAMATTVAKRHGLTLLVDGAGIDPSVPAGTVIFQSPPAVAFNPGPGSQLDVIVASPRAPACTPAQLTLSFRGGEPGAGNDFGSILFRDTGTAACLLAGTVTATGLSAAGGPVTTTVTATFPGGALTPDAAPVPDGGSPAPGELVFILTLQAEYRDGPANVDNGMCQPDWVVPASWRIILAGSATVTVANTDPGNFDRLVPSGGLVTCLGRLSVAAPPAYMSS